MDVDMKWRKAEMSEASYTKGDQKVLQAHKLTITANVTLIDSGTDTNGHLWEVNQATEV